MSAENDSELCKIEDEVQEELINSDSNPEVLEEILPITGDSNDDPITEPIIEAIIIPELSEINESEELIEMQGTLTPLKDDSPSDKLKPILKHNHATSKVTFESNFDDFPSPEDEINLENGKMGRKESTHFNVPKFDVQEEYLESRQSIPNEFELLKRKRVRYSF